MRLDLGPVIQVEATTRGINAITKKLERGEFLRRARESLEDCTKDLHRRVRDKIPADTGNTADGLYWTVNGETIPGMHGIVASPDAHFRVLEHGRRAGAKMPPEQPIKAWADRHGIEGRGVVYVIRRAIGRRGLPAHHMMRDALAEGKQHFPTIWLRRFLTDFKISSRSSLRSGD